MTDKTVIDMYLTQGVNLVPITKGDGKSLKLSGWNRFCTEKYIEDIPITQDFAVMMGKASGNLICLDFDHCDDISVLNDLIPNCLNKTLVIRSGNGYHIYLRIKEAENKKEILLATIYLHKIINGVTQNLELKAHGSYVIGASSDHYDKNDSGEYYKTGKNYRIISNTTHIKNLELNHIDLLQQIKSKDWLSKSEVKVGADGTYVEKESIMELTMRKWNQGERYNNGWRIALDRFMNDWDYDKVLNEARNLNQKCCDPPRAEAEVVRWVNNAIPLAAKNKEDKDSPYFKKNRISLSEAKEDEDNSIGKVADMLLEEFHFKTYKDTDQLLVWDGKIYNDLVAESIVRERCETEIDECTAHNCAEVIAKIKRRSYVMRDQFNFYPCQECKGDGCDTEQMMCGLCGGKGKFNIITLENGILNIDTMNFMEHNQKNLATFYIPITWDEKPLGLIDIMYSDIEKILEGTKFLKYIKDCFTINEKFDGESQRHVYTVFETMAIILLKNNSIQKSACFIGSGSNGKSVLLEYIDSMFGKTNITHIPIQELAEGGFVLSRLDGKLANIFADIESTELRKSGKLKQIIGGEGIEVQRKYQDPYTMYPRAKFIFSANRFPKTYDQTDGFFRRFMVLQWSRKFMDQEKDIHMLEKLITDKKEMSIVFKLLVQLAKNMDKNGDFTFPISVSDIRDTWNEMADPILMYIQERLIDAGGAIATKKEVYEDYVRFARHNEMVPLRIGAFGTEFRNYYEEVTVRDKDTSSVSKYWCDFKIKPNPTQEGAMDKHLK